MLLHIILKILSYLILRHLYYVACMFCCQRDVRDFTLVKYCVTFDPESPFMQSKNNHNLMTLKKYHFSSCSMKCMKVKAVHAWSRYRSGRKQPHSFILSQTESFITKQTKMFPNFTNRFWKGVQKQQTLVVCDATHLKWYQQQALWV